MANLTSSYWPSSGSPSGSDHQQSSPLIRLLRASRASWAILRPFSVRRRLPIVRVETSSSIRTC